jgi:hypothetical protein
MTVDKVIKKFQELRPTKQRGVRLYSTPKTDLIRMVQNAEGNSPCYKGDFAQSCGQVDCCWFKDCKDNRK